MTKQEQITLQEFQKLSIYSFKKVDDMMKVKVYDDGYIKHEEHLFMWGNGYSYDEFIEVVDLDGEVLFYAIEEFDFKCWEEASCKVQSLMEQGKEWDWEDIF